MIASDAGNIGNQTSRSGRRRYSSHLRNHVNRLPDDCGVQRTLRSSNDFRELVRFSGRKKMCALEFELFAHRLLDGSVANDSLLRCADRSVIKTLASQNILNRFRNIRGSLDADRNIAWPNTESGFA